MLQMVKFTFTLDRGQTSRMCHLTNLSLCKANATYPHIPGKL